MKRMKLTALTAVMAFMSVFMINCTDPNATATDNGAGSAVIDGNTVVGGFVYDKLTGKKLTGYEIYVQLAGGVLDTTNKGVVVSAPVTTTAADGTSTTTTPKDEGRYSINSPAITTQEWIINVTMTGYHPYVAVQTSITPSATAVLCGGNSVNVHTDCLVNGVSDVASIQNVPMIALGSNLKAVGKITVVDQDGAAVNDAKLVNTSIAHSTTTGWNYPGGDLAISTTYWQQADIAAATGTNVITIAADTLTRGINYGFVVVKDGYNAATATVNTRAGNLDQNQIYSAAGLVVTLRKENYTYPTFARVVTLVVRDSVTKAPVGTPVLVNTSNAAGAGAPAGTANENFPILANITGDANGVITIPANTMIAGGNYTFKITKAGYDDNNFPFINGGNFTTTTIQTSNNPGVSEVGFDGVGMNVSIVKQLTTIEAPAFLSASNETLVNGAFVPVNGILAVTYTFDRAVKVDTSVLEQRRFATGPLWTVENTSGAGALASVATVSGTDNVSTFTLSDSNNSGTTTTLVFKELTTWAATGDLQLSKAFTIAASGNTVVVTLNGTIANAGDNLFINFTTLLNNVNVAQTAANGVGTALSGFTSAQQESFTYAK